MVVKILLIGGAAVLLIGAVLFLVLPAIAMRDALRDEHKNDPPPRY